MRVAAVQMKIKDGDVKANLERALQLINNEDEKADLYVLPELFTSGYQFSTWDEAISHSPQVMEKLSNFAKSHSSAISGSILAEAQNGSRRNRMFFIGADGEEKAHYDKVHLFGLMDEDKHLSPGEKLTVFNYEGYSFALGVCYDLRFPVQFYRMALAGAEVILTCAEWPKARRNILTTLARARAMETQSYLVLSNRVGEGADGTVFGGSSLVVNPLGEGDNASFAEECLIYGTLDKETLQSTRAKIPVFDDRVKEIDL